MNADASTDNPVLQDRFGRTIDYVRLSVTDRCDFRCVYCMAEDMTFVPRAQVLTLEEMGRLARVLVQLGVKRIRLTGGEPLVRRDVARLVHDIGAVSYTHLMLPTIHSVYLHAASPSLLVIFLNI